MSMVDICDKCLVSEPNITMRRCKRCRVLGCGHKRRAWKCQPRDEQCQEREKEYVISAWVDQLIADGYCVTPSRSLDGHGKYAWRNNAGEWVCSFCRKPMVATPPPNNEAGR